MFITDLICDTKYAFGDCNILIMTNLFIPHWNTLLQYCAAYCTCKTQNISGSLHFYDNWVLSHWDPYAVLTGCCLVLSNWIINIVLKTDLHYRLYSRSDSTHLVCKTPSQKQRYMKRHTASAAIQFYNAFYNNCISFDTYMCKWRKDWKLWKVTLAKSKSLECQCGVNWYHLQYSTLFAMCEYCCWHVLHCPFYTPLYPSDIGFHLWRMTQLTLHAEWPRSAHL